MPRSRREAKRERKNRQGDRNRQEAGKQKIVPIDSVFKREEVQQIAERMRADESDEIDCLIGAVVLSKFDVLKKLLKGGYSIDSCSKDGSTALMWAIRLDIWEMVEFLVKRRASLQIEDNDGNTALLVAVQANLCTQETFLHLWSLVRESTFKINHQNKLGYTVLHHAVRRQWDDAVEALLSSGADPNTATHKGVTPITMASSRLQGRAMKALLQHGADPLIEDKKGCTSLCYAAAFTVHKRIKEMDGVFKEMLELLRSGALRISLKSYLQRRLELLESPPDEKFHKTVSSVIAHIVTFFLHHVPESAGAFLQIKAFKYIRTGLEKHFDNCEYSVSLLRVLRELVRHCDCCMPHVRFEDLATAFNEAAIPAISLRFINRFSSNAGYYEYLFHCFTPLFLTCKHHMTKIWLQRNYKHVKDLYKTYLKNCTFDDSEIFYPDDYHRLMVENHFIYFKSLMGVLLSGNIIQQDIRLPKRTKEKIFEKNLSKTLDCSNVKCAEGKLKLMLKNETITTKKIKDEFCFKEKSNEYESTIFKDDFDSCQESAILALSKNKLAISDQIKNTNLGKIVYPKWREEFKDGCELFGIMTEECDTRDVEDDLKLVTFSEDGKNERVFYLEELFLKLLYIFEIIWQCDFSNGYIKARVINNIPEFTRLMYDLPVMETYYWLRLSENWMHVCKHLKLLPKENVTRLDEVEVCLDSAVESVKDKYRLPKEITERDVILGISRKHSHCLLYQDMFDTGGYVSSQLQSSNNLPSDDEHESSRIYQPTYNLFISHPSLISQVLAANKSTLTYYGKRIEKIPPPPGFTNFTEHEIYEENWRQVVFCKEKHSKLVSELENLRLEMFKHFICESTVIVEPEGEYCISEGGSLGCIYLGLDATTAKPLAVKRISFNESLAQQMRAFKICKLMRRLENVQGKFIVPYTHCVQAERCVLFATPLCQANLEEHLSMLKKEGMFTRLKGKSLVKQMMTGIHFLHTQDPPIIHGNLKPTNILIDASGHLRLAEFGIYEVLYQQLCVSTKSSMWWARETYSYYQSSWKEMVSSKSDIQTCGMISHYILSGGYHPFGLNPGDIARGVLASTPILRLDDPEAVDLISWMLSYSPSDRPNIDQVIMHAFHWNKRKKWRFLLACSGMTNTSLNLTRLYRTIIRCAEEECVDTAWVNKLGKMEGNYKHYIKDINKLTDLLDLLRRKLPYSGKWFLLAFPYLPFILYRLLQNTHWIKHPDFAYFYQIQNV